MQVDFDRFYRAVRSRDPRFDGWFYTGVKTTGIYCRPSCPATTPKAPNVHFYATAAAAQSAGFRACKRCRPDATPGSPEWNVRADLVGRAMRLIADGVVDREGIPGLAGRLAVSERHVHRLLATEVGAGPLALARAQRAHAARLLLETTEMPTTDVAFAAGFASVRQFNDTVRGVFASTPTELRRRAPDRRLAAPMAGALTLRLAYREPFEAGDLLQFLGTRAVPGVEVFADGVYSRTLVLPHGVGVVNLAPMDGAIQCTLHLQDPRDVGTAVQRCRRLMDLDADPVAVAEVLSADPVLAPLVAAAPGRRVPGHVDGAELAVRAVLGQQVSVAGARTLAGRLAARYGQPLPIPTGPLTHAFPTAAALAAADLDDLPLPGARRRALRALVTSLADGSLELHAGSDRAETERRLVALPGIGPWTASYIAMRALGDPDAFLPTDLGVRRAAAALGLASDPRELARHAERWRPWRAYATLHLWGSLSSPASPAALSSLRASRRSPPEAAR